MSRRIKIAHALYVFLFTNCGYVILSVNPELSVSLYRAPLWFVDLLSALEVIVGIILVIEKGGAPDVYSIAFLCLYPITIHQ